MYYLNMKPKSESLYKWKIRVHLSSVLLFFLKRISNLFLCDFHPQGGRPLAGALAEKMSAYWLNYAVEFSLIC